MIRIKKYGYFSGLGHQLMQHLELLRSQNVVERADTSNVTAGLIVASYEPQLDRIGTNLEQDRYGHRRGLSGQCRRSRLCNQHVHPPSNELFSQHREEIVLATGPPVFDCDVLTVNITGVAKAFEKGGQFVCGSCGRPPAQHPDYWHRRLLRPRRERPCGSTA